MIITPRHSCAQLTSNGHVDVVEVLCEHGTDKEAGDADDYTPLLKLHTLGKVSLLTSSTGLIERLNLHA